MDATDIRALADDAVEKLSHTKNEADDLLSKKVSEANESFAPKAVVNESDRLDGTLSSKPVGVVPSPSNMPTHAINSSSMGLDHRADALREEVPGLNLPSKPVQTEPALAPGGKVRLTNSPAIKNAPLPAEGNGSFSNVHLALLILLGPAVLLRLLPFVKARWFGWTSYLFLVALLGVPIAIAYWTVASMCLSLIHI